MAASGAITRMVARIARPVTSGIGRPLRILDRSWNCACAHSYLLSCACAGRAPRDGPDQQLGNCVDDDGDDEEGEADLDQGAAVQVAGGFGKLVGDDGGHGGAVGEQRSVDLGGVADDHGDGHGFAQSAAQAENDGADNADARIAQNADANHLPARGAQSQHGFALRVGHGGHHLSGERGDDGQNHDGENDAGGDIAEAGGVVVGKKAGPAERLDQSRIHVLAKQRHQHEDCPQAVDDAGNGGQQFGDERPEAAQDAGAHFGEEDGDADGQRNRQQQSQETKRPACRR